MKTCTKCGESKPTTEFSKNAKNRDGLQYSCKACDISYAKKYRENNPDATKAAKARWREANVEKIRAYASAYRIANRESRNAASAAYYANNKDKEKEKAADRWRKNRDVYIAKQADWRNSNREKSRSASRRWAFENADRVRENKIKWAERNKERISLLGAEWRKLNKNKVKLSKHNRRARLKYGGSRLSSGISDRLFKLQRGKCACCHKSIKDNYHLDHIMPLSRGGLNTDDNVQLLCPRCNHQKHAKHPVDFMQSKGFLI